MSRVPLPLFAADLSRFARALGRALRHRHLRSPEPPGHVELMNLLARAAGHRNLQSLQHAAPCREACDVSSTVPVPVPVLTLDAHGRKALGHFDDQARLVRWPTKLSIQRLTLWALWTRFESKRRYTEREVNQILRCAHTFGDFATLRRELINHRLLARESDCSAYWKLQVRADDPTRAFLHQWRQRAQAAATVSEAVADRHLQDPLRASTVAQRLHRQTPRPPISRTATGR